MCRQRGESHTVGSKEKGGFKLRLYAMFVALGVIQLQHRPYKKMVASCTVSVCPRTTGGRKTMLLLIALTFPLHVVLLRASCYAADLGRVTRASFSSFFLGSSQACTPHLHVLAHLDLRIGRYTASSSRAAMPVLFILASEAAQETGRKLAACELKRTSSTGLLTVAWRREGGLSSKWE